MWRYSALSVARDSSAREPASSTPVGPPPTTTKVVSAATSAGSVRVSAQSKDSRMRRRICSASGSVFSTAACLRPLVVAEPGVGRAGRQDQVVVVDRARVAHADLPLDLVDALDVAEHHRDVLVRAEQRADRRGDVRGRQRRGRDLVEQRLEQVVVGAVDQHQLDVELGDVHRRLQAAEAAADDGDDRLAGLLAGEQGGLVLGRHGWLHGAGRIARRRHRRRRRRINGVKGGTSPSRLQGLLRR